MENSEQSEEILVNSDKTDKKSKQSLYEKVAEKFPRTVEFFKKYWGLFLAPLIAFAIYMFQLAMSDVYPFGSAYVVASYDLSAQICPFIEHLFDVMQGKSSLLYTYSIVGGADVFGTFAYFFISPFSFIYLLFGDGKVYNACGIVMALKLATIAFSGAWFVKKLFKNIPDFIGVGIGVVYAYCGYVFVASTYVNWIDFLIYMPFAAAAFVHFAKTGKFLPFSILIACCIYTCFSIACFSMFVAFPALVAYGLICVEKEGRSRFIAYLCLSFLVAVLIALPLLIPALMAYLRSGRGGGLFDEFWYGFASANGSQGLSPSKFNPSNYFERYNESLYRKCSYIFSDSVFAVLTIVYFVRTKFRTKLSRFMLVAGLFTLVPVLVDESMLLMNMGSYMSYALRFGFLNALYFLGGACLAIADFNFDSEKSEDGFLTKSKESSVIFYAVVSLAAAVLTAYFVSSDAYLNIWENIFKDSTLIGNCKGFSSSYAHSLGGLQVVIVLFAIVGFVTVLGLLMVRNKEIGARVMAVFLMCVVGVQVLFYNEQLIVGNRSTHYNYNHYQTIMNWINEEDDEYFRVKDYNEKLTKNIPFTGNSNSYSVFSSVIDADNFEVTKMFGYAGNSRNSLGSSSGNVFGDAFLGYKYFFVNWDKEKDKSHSVANLKYVSPVKHINEKGEEEDMGSGAFYMYRNNIVFPNGYTVKDGAFRFAKENTSGNRTANQRALYEFLGGKQGSGSVSWQDVEALSKDLRTRAADVKVGRSKITATVTAEADDYLFLNFVATKGYKVTVNGRDAELIDNDIHFLSVKLEEGENTVVFTYTSPYPKYAAAGLLIAVIALAAIALIVKKTTLFDKIAPVIAWCGIALAAAVVLFFMVFPIGVYFYKLFCAAKVKFFTKT